MRALTESLWSLAVVGYLLTRGTGCAAAPDRLRVAIDLNNAAVTDLAEARAAHEARLVAAYRRREALCPPLPDQARTICQRDAQVAALQELAPEESYLGAMTLAERMAADALAAAVQCRADGLSCEAAKLDEAERGLAEVRAWLAGGVP